MDRAVLLSGEHPTLPMAELEALLAVHDPEARVRESVGRVAVVAPGDRARTDAALNRMALAHAWGVLWAAAGDDETGLEALAAGVAGRGGAGSAAVEAVRAGGAGRLRRMHVERRLGRALQDAGHEIDLRAPQHRVQAWLAGGRIVVSERRGTSARQQFEARAPERRAHFAPIGLHPRRAASLVHLARVPPGSRIYDPFCGTGGILLEAALDGYDVVGSDIDPVMVQGCLQSLADDGPEPLAGDVFVADVGEAPDRLDTVDAIVTDLPYGAASTTRREPLEALYARAFAAFARLLEPGARAVFGMADASLLRLAAGFRVEQRHDEFVHRSLTRHFAVVIRDPAVDRPA